MSAAQTPRVLKTLGVLVSHRCWWTADSARTSRVRCGVRERDVPVERLYQVSAGRDGPVGRLWPWRNSALTETFERNVSTKCQPVEMARWAV